MLILPARASEPRIHNLPMSPLSDPRYASSEFNNNKYQLNTNVSSNYLSITRLRLLFSFLTRHDLLFLVVPAVAASMCSGAVAPFMTLVIGKVFNAFADFPLTPNPPASAKHQLLHDVGTTALELLDLAAGALSVCHASDT